MRMDFDVAGVDQEPLKVRRIDELLQESFPNALVAPADKAAVGVAPSAIIRRQIPPGRPRAQDPKDRVDESSVVLRPTTPNNFPPRPMRVQQGPNLIRDVVSSMCGEHPLLYHTSNLVTTLSKVSCFHFDPCANTHH